jgi:hypothetical protein
MKKLLLLILYIFLSYNVLYSQENIQHRAFYKTDKEKVLFPENENRNIILTDIVESPYMADTIYRNIKDWVKEYEIEFEGDVDDLLDITGKFKFRAEVPVGTEFFSTPVGYFPRSSSEIEFTICIEYKDYRFKYTLDNFYTKRRMIRGEAKSEGQSNMIHFQRINSLLNEKEAYRKEKETEWRTKKIEEANEKLKEYDMIIENEKKQYKLEYQTVLKIIADMRKKVAYGNVSDF